MEASVDKNAFVKTIPIEGESLRYYDIDLLEKKGIAEVSSLPFSIRILCENLLRHLDGAAVTEADLEKIARWTGRYDTPVEIPFHPCRVLMQDFTGVPAVVDLAAMRDAVKVLGKNPKIVNPLIPVELVVDHSVQLDYFGTADALEKNVAKEYERNEERYALLKWAQKSFENVKVVPPNSGICHQVNLEHLGRVVMTRESKEGLWAFPDTLVGTDSHTPMINGIGVVGWGVGGIEAEGVMLGQPYFMAIPEVVGVRLSGALERGVTGTDLVLAVTEMLRKKGVVEKFVEYFGPGARTLTVPQRATISNMSPECGATINFFPVDDKTIDYLVLTRGEKHGRMVEAYTRACGLFGSDESRRRYTEVLELDLSTVRPAVAGPARPQDRIDITNLKAAFKNLMGCACDRDADPIQLSVFREESGRKTPRPDECPPSDRRAFEVDLYGKKDLIGDGSVVIAAITSCTNTSNPEVLVGAGLLAKAAVQKGLKVPAFVKTSLAPGSRVVVDYLEAAGLLPYLEALGFHVVGFGCTTCIGNSGPLHPQIESLVDTHGLTVAAVLSGNRNFEARIHQKVRANFLASPMLVVCFALAGRIDVDLTREPLGLDPNGEPVYLKDIWPSEEAVQRLIDAYVKSRFFQKTYRRVFTGDAFWKKMSVGKRTTFPWAKGSTYIKRPPYFDGLRLEKDAPEKIEEARVLLCLGDTVTTDHISPAGAIPETYPAGRYLVAQGVPPEAFNSYGARRGNHEIMVRGTFGNIRIKNRLVAPKEGSYTLKFPEKKEMPVFDAAMAYAKEGVPLVVLAGKEYGTGSSRDWAAKGTRLLGVRAVIAESFERIHRSNLVGMGVLPLVFADAGGYPALPLDGTETLSIPGISEIQPRKVLEVIAEKANGSMIRFPVITRLDTPIEVEYFLHGGILPYVARKIFSAAD
ncbi:MAG: aconitate hydratase AcnA [Deltaproteobacteria bacterium]|nr:aconitate hydratase AcnA [Deltaproteobacteria bacterium]